MFSQGSKADRKRKGDELAHTNTKLAREEPALLSGTQQADLKKLAKHLKNEQAKRSAMLNLEIEAQHGLFLPPNIGINSAALTNGDGIAIDASVGSSGFFPPEDIEKAIDFISENVTMEYNLGRELCDVIEKKLTLALRDESVIGNDERISFTEPAVGALTKVKYVVLGCGSQHIITTLFDVLIKTPGDVIVVPVPTYGLLLDPIRDAKGSYQFMPLKSENDFALDPIAAASFIANINNKFREAHQAKLEFKVRKIEKYISKPNLKAKPVYQALLELKGRLSRKTSLGRKAIKKLNQELANYIHAHVQVPGGMKERIYKEDLLEKLSIPFCNTVRGYLHINPHNPTGKIWSQDEINGLSRALYSISKLTIIEDLAHKDIQLTDKAMGFFSRTKMANQTVSVMSYSKNMALAGKRLGFAVGDHRLINKIDGRIYKKMVFPPQSIAKKINAVISTPKAVLQKYFNECNSIYRYRLSLVKAFLNGIDSISDPVLKSKILSDIKMYASGDHVLQTGITNLTLLVEPEGCFFVMLDCSQYKEFLLDGVPLLDGIDFAKFFYYAADVETIPAELMGYSEKPSLRFSLSLNEEEICYALMRISKALSYLESPIIEKSVLPGPVLNRRK